MLIHRFENPRALKNYAESTLPVLCKWNNKACVTARPFTTWVTEYFKPTVDPLSEKKIPFKISLLTDNAPGHPRALMEMDSGMNGFHAFSHNIRSARSHSNFQALFFTKYVL